MMSPCATISVASKVTLFDTPWKKMVGGRFATICSSTGTVTVEFTAFEVKTMEPLLVPTGSPVGSIAKKPLTMSFLIQLPPVTDVSDTVSEPSPAFLRLTNGENGYSSAGEPCARRTTSFSVEGTAIGSVVTRIDTGRFVLSAGLLPPLIATLPEYVPWP